MFQRHLVLQWHPQNDPLGELHRASGKTDWYSRVSRLIVGVEHSSGAHQYSLQEAVDRRMRLAPFLAVYFDEEAAGKRFGGDC